MNLFWSTRALTDAREDHLTEFFASALEISEEFRTAYYDFVVASHAEKNGWGAIGIESVQTQVAFKDTTCCPDMILNLSNGKRIACEHKLDALETLGPERDPRWQLQRYLDLPIDGLVYTRSSWKPPGADILANPKYIHPTEREHFLWRDFYPLFNSDHILIAWLREGFERLGFTPPHPSIGEMSGPDEVTNRLNRENFAKLWGRTRSFAHTIGWKVGTGAIVELYLTENPNSLASSIFISPTKAERFLFRVTPQKNKSTQVEKVLRASTLSVAGKVEIRSREVARKEGKELVVDLTTSLREILGVKFLSPEEIENKLLLFVQPLLLAVDRQG